MRKAEEILYSINVDGLSTVETLEKIAIKAIREAQREAIEETCNQIGSYAESSEYVRVKGTQFITEYMINENGISELKQELIAKL